MRISSAYHVPLYEVRYENHHGSDCMYPVTCWFLLLTPLLSQTTFAMAVTSTPQIGQLIHSICWTYLHLLQFNVSNQCLSIEEDIRNKPDRPLAASRISLESTVILRWALLPLCLAQSLYYSWATFWVSVILAIAFILYNECGGHAIHWSSRNIMNAFGLSMFEAGATLTICELYLAT